MTRVEDILRWQIADAAAHNNLEPNRVVVTGSHLTSVLDELEQLRNELARTRSGS